MTENTTNVQGILTTMLRAAVDSEVSKHLGGILREFAHSTHEMSEEDKKVAGLLVIQMMEGSSKQFLSRMVDRVNGKGGGGH